MIIALILFLFVLVIILTDLYMRRRASRFIKISETEANANYNHLPSNGDPLVTLVRGIYQSFTSTENRLLRVHKVAKANSHLPFKMILSTFLNFDFILVWDTAVIKQVLFTKKTSFDKVRSLVPSFDEIFGESLVVVSGEQWHKQRTLMKPSFSFDRLKTLVPIFYRLANRLSDKLLTEEDQQTSSPSNKKTDEINNKKEQQEEDEKQKKRGVDFDPSMWMSRLTLDGLGLGGFGFNFGAIDGQNQKEYEVYHNLIYEFINPLRVIPFYDGLNTEQNRKYQANVQFMKQFLLEVIEKKKKANEEAHKTGGKDLLDLMIQHSSLGQHSEENSDDDDAEIFDETEAREPSETLQKKKKNNEDKEKINKEHQKPDEKKEAAKGLSDRELAHNLFLFFLAGHETSSSALSLMLAMLAKHQDVQEKLRREIMSVSGEEEFSSEMISKLEYLNMVLKESLRLHSPAGALTRKAIEDTEISGFFIPKGSMMMLLIYSIHRDKEVWGEDAEEFRPERFDKKNLSQRSGLAYMPFGSGERSCLGINFALLEMKTSLCCLLRRFRFEEHPEFPVAEMKYDNQVTLRTPAGFKLRAVPLS